MGEALDLAGELFDAVLEVADLGEEGGGRGMAVVVDDAAGDPAGVVGDAVSTLESADALENIVLILGDAETNDTVAFSENRHRAERTGSGAGGGAAEGADPAAVDGDGDGALEQGDADDDAGAGRGGVEDAFEAAQGAFFEADVVAGVDERPGQEAEAGGGEAADGLEFGVIDGEGAFAGADDGVDAGGGEDGEAMGGVEAAEKVGGEKGEEDVLEAAAGAVAAAVEGQEFLVTFAAEDFGNDLFMTGLAVHGEPEAGHFFSVFEG